MCVAPILLNPFATACFYGQVELVKWFVQLGSVTDIHWNTDEPFRVACINYHMDVCKYLIAVAEHNQRPINIHVIDADIPSIIYHNYELFEWLFVLGIKSYGKFDLSSHMETVPKSTHRHRKKIYNRMQKLVNKYYDK